MKVVAPIERFVFAVAAAQRLAERTTALVHTARVISRDARAARQRSAMLRLLTQRQRAKSAA